MNADGKTDLVMLYDYKNESITRFKIYFSNGTGFDSNYTKIEVPYVNRDDNLRFFMDIDSDRKPEWVTINKDSLNKMVINRIDIDSKVVTSNDYGFHFNKPTNYKNISFADVNADRKLDIIGIMEDSSISVCLFTGDAFSEVHNSDSLEPKPQFLKEEDNSNTFVEKQNTKYFIDMNGDFQADLISYNGTNKKIYISYSDGRGFPKYDLEKEAVGLYQLTEVNGDFKADILALGLQEKVKKTPFLFTLDGFFVESMDINEYEPIATLEILFSDKESYDLVDRITTNDGKEININYEFVRDIEGAVQTDSGNYPIHANLSPRHLVTKIEKKLSDDLPIQRETYSYKDSKMRVGKTDEMGDLGFKSTRKDTSLITPEGEEKKVSTQVMEFNQKDILETGKPATTNTYNTNGNLRETTSIQYEKVTTPNGTMVHRIKSQERTRYDDGNYYTKESINLEYDTNENITKETRNLEGNTTEIVKTYSSLNKVLTHTKKSNGVVVENQSFGYTDSKLTSVSTEIQSGKWSTINLEHDEKGNVNSITDPLGKVTTIVYDQNSQAIEVTNHLGHTTYYEYDSLSGELEKKTNPNGGAMEVEYDVYGRILELKKPGEHEWSNQFIYSDSPNNQYVEARERVAEDFGGISFLPLSLIGQQNTYTWTKTYVDNGGKVRKRESSGRNGKVYTEDFVYDYLGRLTSQSEPYISNQDSPKYTSFEYNDSESRITKIVKYDGNETTISYDKFTVTKTSTNEPTEIVIRDVLGQVVSQQIGDFTTTYSFDEAGNVKTVTKPGGEQVTFKYDRVANILSKTDPNLGKTSFEYDLSGNLTSTKDARGVTTNYSFDEYGRLKKYIADEEEIEYFYNENQENAKGRVTKVKDSSGETQFYYDPKGNIIKKIRSIEDYKITFEYKFDSLDRVREIIYPDGTVVSYVYDDKELSAIKILPNDGKSKELQMLGFQYDESTNKFTKTYGNGVVTEYDFDSTNGQLTSYKLTTGTTKRLEEHKKYFYDTSGNITTINDLANPWRSQTFSYDTYNRLIKSAGSYGEREYVYSTNGNLTQKGDTTMQYTSTDHTNAVTSVTVPNRFSSQTFTYEYDDAGYIQKRNNDTFTHDGLGRLSSLVTGHGEEFNYFYDYRGIRKKKIYRNKDEVAYYFGDGLYEIHVAPSVPSRHTLYVKNGDELIAQWTRTDAVITQDESSFLFPYFNFENQGYLILLLFFIILTTLLLQTKPKHLCPFVFIRCVKLSLANLVN